MKSIATYAALAIIGAAVDGLTSMAIPTGPAASHIQPVAFGVPLPQDPAPAADVPTAAELTSLLNKIVDPDVSFMHKSQLVEGGIGSAEAHIGDRELKNAAQKGELPLLFSVTNIRPGTSGSATADVSVSGPKLNPPVTQNITFINKGSWVLSRHSAMELLQAAGR
nr:B1937_F3_91 [Mycobacterium leprae]